jgi:cytochrome b pre-mRNA-processing protein 3
LAGFLGLFRRGRHERAGFQLYTTAVTAARDPFLYTDCGVPDTLDGRFDLIGLHTFLVIRRLTREAEPGPALAQAVFDAMFSDMDINLRELGVGDLSVGRKVKEMWDAFHGRSKVYTAALDADDPEALEAAIARNVWRGGEPPAGAPAALARIVRAQIAHLTAQPITALVKGEVGFLPAREAAQ